MTESLRSEIDRAGLGRDRVEVRDSDGHTVLGWIAPTATSITAQRLTGGGIECWPSKRL